MNLYLTPPKNLFNESKRSSLDNSPAFFTGCVDCIGIVSSISSLCSTCSLSSILPPPELLVNGEEKKSDTNEQMCQNHSFILDSNDLQIQAPNFNNSTLSSSVDVNNHTLYANDTSPVSGQKTIKRTLLPLPSSSSMSDLRSYNNKMHPRENSFKRQSFESISSPKSDLSEIKCNADEEIQIIKTITNFVGNKRKSEGEGISPALKKRYRRPSVVHRFQPSEDELSRSIWKIFYDSRQSEETYNKKMILRDQLHQILLQRFPSCGLYVVGSSMTGLGADSSDMDMCLMLTDSEIDQEVEAANILQVVRDLFIHYNFLLDVEVIYAKVPILRFKDIVSGIEVDLNINNSVGIRNTQLLSSYARIDERFPPLVLLAKLWARFQGINDAKNNMLSSYSLVLMVVHYLQYECTPSVLPCLQILQPDKFNPNSDVRLLKLHEDLPKFESENKEDLGTLFLGFLNYFSFFRFQDNVMSVRLGCVVSKQAAMFSSSPKNKKGHWKFICIEEPFDLTNTARAVFKPEAFYYMKQVFVKSFHRLRKSTNLDSILKDRCGF